MAAPFAPSTAATSTPTVVRTPAPSNAPKMQFQAYEEGTGTAIIGATISITTPPAEAQECTTIAPDGKCEMSKQTSGRTNNRITVRARHSNYNATNAINTTWTNGHLVRVPMQKKQQTAQQTVTVTGIIQDNNGDPLVGVNATIPQTPIGAPTRVDGSFTLQNVPRDATLMLRYIGYKDQKIDLSEKSITNDTINIGTIKLEEDRTDIDEVTITNYPKPSRKPQHAEDAIIYHPQIRFTPIRGTDGSSDSFSFTSPRRRVGDKNVICKCKSNYILMTRDLRSFSGEITLSSGNIKSYNSTGPNGMCDENYSNNGDHLEYLLLLATELHDKGLQCVAQTSCSNARNVTESHYQLNGTQYKCIVDECSTGYTRNEAQDGCVKIEDCRDTLPNNAANVKTATYRRNGENITCEVTECECGYDISDDKKSCTVWKTDTCSRRTKIHGATSMQRFCSGETEVCHATSCDSEHELVSVTEHNYTLPNGMDTLQTCQSHERKCTEEERNRYTEHHRLTEWPTNIIKKETAINFNTTGARICIPTECECEYDLKDAGKKNARCEKWPANMACYTKPEHAAEGQYHRACRRNGHEYCHITECEANYKPNNSNDECVGKRGACKPSIENPQHHGQIWDSKFKTVNGKRTCVITKCATGYEPNEDGSDCTPLMVLPEKESQERIDELRTVYDEALANESSTANKALGVASMAATGAGGMMLAMGLTEQKADKEAEEKMRGYVATFKCNYGNTNVEYGTQPTELPMSTELYNLYAEYVTLANDLKLRKEMLGLRAGIESEKILDSATTGLYDDVSSGRSAGMYTSLARAILDPNGADAAAWAEQTKRSKNLIIAGATTAGVGVVGSIVGNQLINKGKINLSKVKEDIKGINERYKNKRQAYSDLVDNITDAANDSDLGATVDVDEAADESGEDDDETGENTEGAAVLGENPETLENGQPAEGENDQAAPESEPVESDAPQATSLRLSIPTSALWASGKHTWEDITNTNNARDLGDLLSQTITALDNFINQVNNQETSEPQITADNPVKITVTGHTDTVGRIQDNITLSQDRAGTMTTKLSELMTNMNNKELIYLEKAVGKGEDECTCQIEPSDNDTPKTNQTYEQYCPDGKSDNKIETANAYNDDSEEKIGVDYAPCRRVDIVITPPQVTDQWFDGVEQIDLQTFINEFNNQNT